MTYAAQVDDNHAAAAKLCTARGWSVEHLHAAGRGVPDLLIGAKGLNFLVEMVGEAKWRKYKKTGGLNERQVPWHAGWKGQAIIARTPEFAVECIERELRALGRL